MVNHPNGQNGHSDPAYALTRSIIRRNRLKDTMDQGEFAFAFGLQVAACPEIVHLAQIAGFTGVAMNLEHCRTGIETAANINCAALNLGLTPVVIVPSLQSDWISRLLDNGAQVIIVPRTESVQMAKDLVKYSKHRPIGERPLAFTPQMQYQLPNFKYALEAQNETTMSVPMIESVKGLEQVEGIASTPGVDMLFIGAHDLSDDMGLIGEYEHPDMLAAFDRICNAAKKASGNAHTVYIGLGGCEGCPDFVSRLRKKHDNIRFMLAGRDLTMLFSGMRGMIDKMRTIA